MAATKIADVIVPDVFNPYVTERTAELSALVQSGIISQDEELNRLALTGGKLINMPFWTDLDGDDEVLSDSVDLTVGSIDAGKDIAVLFMRGRAWGVNDLAKALAGSDPMAAIGDLVAAYWARREQATLFAILKGVFADNAANDSGDLVLSVADEDGDNANADNLIGGEVFIDALTKLGDAMGRIAAVAMHSTPYARLLKNDLIAFEKDSDGNDTIPVYMGKRVIVDDGCPKTAGATSGYKYTSYLFGPGAIGRGDGAAPTPTETDRAALAGEDRLINRRHFLLHPRGVKFTSTTVAGESPTNTECEDADNWDRVYEKKNIRMVKLETNG